MATQEQYNKEGSHQTDVHDYGRWDFVKLAIPMGAVSLILTVIALGFIIFKGMNYGIDFRGGTEMQVRFPAAVEAHQVRTSVEELGIKNPAVQSLGAAGNEFLIRLETPHAATEKETNALIANDVTKIKTALKSKFQLTDEGVLRVDTVGPAVGSELRNRGLLAAFYAFLVILIYVAVRFDYKFAPGAVICLIHDTIVTLGVFALLGREFNVQIMAAVLTLIGYSLNDTIVTFDRIRETIPHYRDRELSWIINRAINDMFVRTMLTSGCTMIAVLGLYFFGGGVISEIAFTLIIGIVIGTYSSVYVASPLVLLMDKFKRAPVAKRQAA